MTCRDSINDAERVPEVKTDRQDEDGTAAPPQPAPDAMREALRVISTMAVYENGEVDENLRCIVDACRDVASAALSAPVPPADGAGSAAFNRGAREGWMRCGVYHIDIDFEGRESELAEINQRWPIPPSATGAAKPVAWRIRFPDGSGCTQWFDGKPPKYYGPYEVAYATPPVRGDREILHDAIMGAAKLHTHDHALALKIANDAILSLPVQPGAGEREATIRECARIAKFGAKECADVGDTDWQKGFRYAAHATALEIENKILALSCQPQQSSE